MPIAQRYLPALMAMTTGVILTGSALGQGGLRLGDDDAWFEAESLDPSSPEGQLAQIRVVLAEGDFSRAEDLATDWIDRNEAHRLQPVALLTRGDAFYGREDYYEALFDYEMIVRLYPGSEVFITSLRRELDIATRFGNGLRRKLWGVRLVDASDIAEELLIRVQERLPGSNLAEEAGMELGDYYFRRREMSLAVDAYDLFIDNYPNSEQLTKARRRLIAAHLASFKGPQFDAAGLYNARSRLREMKAIEPAEAQRLGADALIAGINERDASKMLTTAKWYLRVHDPIATEFTLRRMIRAYPRSAAAADGLRLIPDVLPLLANNLRNRVEPLYNEWRAGVLGIEPPEPSDDSTAADGEE